MADGALLGGLFGLDGKVAIITGATSGIGEAVTGLFLDAGANVVVSGGTAAKLDRLLKTLRGRTPEGQRVVGLAADVSREPDIQALFQLADATFGRLDILVNSAGIFKSVPFLETDVEFWDRVQEVNSRGAYLTNREAVRRMKSQGQGGSIINISSVSGLQTTVNGHAQYGASKAAVNMLTKTLAYEFGPDNIRVNAVLPGATNTAGLRDAIRDYAEGGQIITGPSVQLERLPLGRMGEPEEIANICLFLASKAASYVTGQLIIADGAFHLS